MDKLAIIAEIIQPWTFVPELVVVRDLGRSPSPEPGVACHVSADLSSPLSQGKSSTGSLPAVLGSASAAQLVKLPLPGCIFHRT